MSLPEPRVVVDASAVLAYVLHERGWQTVDKILPFAVLPLPNLTEVLYRAPSKGHAREPGDLFAQLLRLGLRTEPVEPADAVRAAELIVESDETASGGAGRPLSLGDGLCIAVAERLQLPVTGGDQAWELLELTTTFHSFR